MTTLISGWRQQDFVTLNGAPSIPSGTRAYVVGDVHGRSDLLDEALVKIDQHSAASGAAQSIEIFLGDYIDRGPNSCQVIERLIERQLVHQAICLKGNHEALLLDALDNPAVIRHWRKLGGISTLLSYGVPLQRMQDSYDGDATVAALRARIPEQHVAFMKNAVTHFVYGDFLFVHAGIRPGIALSDQKVSDMLWIRQDFLESSESFEKFVVHGHSPVRRPDIRNNRINIDTGAYASGILTCLVIEEGRVSFL